MDAQSVIRNKDKYKVRNKKEYHLNLYRRVRLMFIFIVFIHAFALSQENRQGYMFRLVLKDKRNTPYSINKPEEFLSQKAVERRLKQGLRIDDTDLPVNPFYLETIREKGAEIKAVSKWLNTVVVYFPDSLMVESMHELPFVESVTWVWVGKSLSGDKLKFGDSAGDQKSNVPADASYYGAAYGQIHMHRGDRLHEVGFKGKGMTIAVIDATFTSVDKIDFFDISRILGFRNFTHQSILPSPSDEEHGTRVLSCMLANKPGEMVGTAPEANYYLIQTEVLQEEYEVEEDYWVAGIEYADSLGVDIVTSSLGYTTFDEVSMNHTHIQLNGKTAQVSRAASMASEKGILLFVAAGNERYQKWEKIGFPADADGIVTVGGVDSQKEISYFSSVGYTVDRRIKPDLMAKGTGVSVVYHQSQSGVLYPYANGTSFSTPILAGLGACLWQAFPDLTNLQIIDLLKENADRYQHPDSLYGYGIPDVYLAYLKTLNFNGIVPVESPAIFRFDSATNLLYINLSVDDCINSKLQIFSVLGNRVLQKKSLAGPVDMQGLAKGVYIVVLECNAKRYVRKFIKL